MAHSIRGTFCYGTHNAIPPGDLEDSPTLASGLAVFAMPDFEATAARTLPVLVSLLVWVSFFSIFLRFTFDDRSSSLSITVVLLESHSTAATLQ